MRRSLVLLIIAATSAAGTVIPADAEPASAPSASRGWYSSLGGHEAANENYCAGMGCFGAPDIDMRNFFAYDLTAYEEQAGDFGVSAASLNLSIWSPASGIKPFELHHVATPVAKLDLNREPNSAAGLAIFQDLGDGTVLGAMTPVSTVQDPIVVPLNAEGRLAVTERLGEHVAFGGVQVGSTGSEHIFGGTSEDLPPEATTLSFTLVPGTALTLDAPRTVARGSRPLITGTLTSNDVACTQGAELHVTAGKGITEITDDEGAYDFRVTVRKRTKIRVFYEGSDACGPSDVLHTIRIER